MLAAAPAKENAYAKLLCHHLDFRLQTNRNTSRTDRRPKVDTCHMPPIDVNCLRLSFAMTTEDFFIKPKEQSRIKAAIVGEYFDVWANIILPHAKRRGSPISYVDLFAGKGSYEDGTPSTPLIILKKALGNPDLRDRLITEFNDSDPQTTDALTKSVLTLPEIETLRYAPKITSAEVGLDTVERFEKAHLPPTLLFADPFGFKGLSLRLIKAVLKDWGCDCIFFFNFNSINRWVTAEIVRHHIDQLFGMNSANELRSTLPNLSPHNREVAIIDTLKSSIKELGIRYVHTFSFEDIHSERTSHHIVLATKHLVGYSRFKDITAKFSSESVQGVASFRFDPNPDRQTRLIFQGPLDDLQSMLLRDFAGESLTLREVHDRHSIDRPYRLPDYRKVLVNLEEQGAISVDRPIGVRAGVLSDDVLVTFPK